MIDLLETIIIPFFLFTLGFFIMKQFIKGKRWENAVIIALVTNLIWLILSIFLTIIVLDVFGDSPIYKVLLIPTLIPIGLLILWGVFNKDIIESIKVTGFIQGTLIVIMLIFSLIPKLLDIWLIEGNDDLDGSKFTFVFAFLFLFGLSILMANWGDKIQLVRHRITFTLYSVTPGVYYLLISFLNLQAKFFELAFINIIVSFAIAIISIIIVKSIAYQTIELKKLRELTILEKDKQLLNINDLKVHYPLFKGTLKRQVGAVKAVDGVSISIKTGETLGLVGESGCGKTTIAKAILGLLEKTEGEIYFQDNSVPPKYSAYLRHKIQMVFQDPDASLNPRMKIVDILAEPLRNLLAITNRLEIRKRVLRLLDEVSLKREHMDRYPHEFSGGQKQRIVIARALACNPELIILDEPTSALDVSVQAQILNL
ncbi:MAG: ATP-binding cassette domain-containing protein, partial [Candidatus Thorarchaeota archaeon]